MKITLILFLYVIVCSKRSLQKPIFDQKGVKNQNFKSSNNLPIDNFRNICCVQIWSRSDKNCGRQPEHTHDDNNNNGHFSIPVYQYTNIPLQYSTTNHPTYLPTIRTSTTPLYPSLMFCYQALRADKIFMPFQDEQEQN